MKPRLALSVSLMALATLSFSCGTTDSVTAGGAPPEMTQEVLSDNYICALTTIRPVHPGTPG